MIEIIAAAQGAGISEFYSSDDDHTQRGVQPHQQYQQGHQMQQQSSHMQHTSNQMHQQQAIAQHHQQQMSNPYGNVEDFQVIFCFSPKFVSVSVIVLK